MTLNAGTPNGAAPSPCSDAQQVSAHACAEAERLAAAARLAVEQALGARRERADLERTYESDGRLGDRHALADAKTQARQAYRTGFARARDSGHVMVAAATWMNGVSRLNHRSRRAARRADGLARRQAEVEALVERLELAADAARVAADSARQQCLDARRALAACEEAHDARLHRLPPPPPPRAGVTEVERAPLPVDAPLPEPAVVPLLRGDRRALQRVVVRLAEELGQDAGRLHLLMLDLREAIVGAGRMACLFDFPPRHPFWSQFTTAEARAVAVGLASLNRRFDGHGGWLNGQVATSRELAMAVSLAGRDPRSVRPSPGPAELATLWLGTTVAADEFLFANAPDLRLEALTGLLGPRADALAELWDNWGRLRPLLLGS